MEHLTNDSLRKRLDGIARIQEIIEERRLDWLGIVARQPDSNFPKRLLTAWTCKQRKNCGQKLTLRDLNATAINPMLDYNGINNAPSKECSLAKECNQWITLV
jgi:hypothetical protein